MKKERELQRAELAVRNLVGRSIGLKTMLERKAVLSLKANNIAFEGKSCTEKLNLVVAGRGLKDTDKLKVNLGGYKNGPMTIADIRAKCAWINDNVEVFRKAIKVENKKFAKKQIKEFCGGGKCKGKAQKKAIKKLISGGGIKVGVTNLTSAPGEVANKGGKIVWTWKWGYGGAIWCSCDRIVFNGSGSKIVKKHNQRCLCR